MTADLPPSKFGAGYTFGEDPLASRIPPSPAPNPSYGGADSWPTIPPASTPVATTAAVAYPPATPVAPGYGGGNLPVAPAGGGTAITAAIFALLMGVYAGYQAVGQFRLLALFSGVGAYLGENSFTTYLTAMGAASSASALALIIGAILLLTRKSAGRGLVAIGCLIVIAQSVVSAAVVYGWLTSLAGSLGVQESLLSGDDAWFLISLGAGIAVPLLTLILALLGSTQRWCQAKSAGLGYAAPPAYP